MQLFGQKIPLPGDADPHTLSGNGSDLSPANHVDKEEEEEEEQEENDREGGDDDEGEKQQEPQPQEEKDQRDEDPGTEKVTEGEQEADPPPNAEEAKNSGNSPEAIANPKTPSIEEETAKSKDEKSEKEQSQEKTLKKPDKVLPCPRCNSMDTKFCYYNNYNVNQPRYFCKGCQRYWTAGGTMRNVPVGAGRRKNKNSASHYRHITISEALQAARIDAPNGTHLLESNGRVLSFGLDAPVCDSMASVLNIGEKKVLNGTRNGFHCLEDQNQRFPIPCRSGENADDSSSSMGENQNSKSNSTFPQPVLQNNGFLPQLPCIPNIPWPYTWNSQVPPPALCPSGFPLPIYPAFWNWNVPWFPSHSSASTPKSPSSGPNSPTLGKHSRDGDVIKQDPLQKEEPSKQRNGCVLVPKTLRIDDPNEAAKSSIWATLGIENESGSGRGMFNKAFQSTKEGKKHVDASPVLMANPAALSRSLNFHENS